MFNRNIASGLDLGASVAVVEAGHVVVDLWGGFATQDKAVPWDSNTITNVYSTTKTMVALVALMLIDRGQITPEDKVAKYWPEFASSDKADVTVAQIMSHTSGLPAWDPEFVLSDLYDWQRATSRLAESAPWWTPGTASGYHMLTYGHLIGEVVRRVTGATLGQYFRTEVALPLNIDFQIGLPSVDFSRVAPVFLGEGERMAVADRAQDSMFVRVLNSPDIGGVGTVSTTAWRQAEIGAANGHGNARSVALAQSAITNGGVIGGKRLLSPSTIELASKEQIDGIDLVLGIPFRFGLGYALSSPHYPIHSKEKVMYWGGFGGSRVINLPERGVTFAYVMNKLRPGAILGEPRGDDLFAALLECLN